MKVTRGYLERQLRRCRAEKARITDAIETLRTELDGSEEEIAGYEKELEELED